MAVIYTTSDFLFESLAIFSLFWVTYSELYIVGSHSWISHSKIYTWNAISINLSWYFYSLHFIFKLKWIIVQFWKQSIMNENNEKTQTAFHGFIFSR